MNYRAVVVAAVVLACSFLPALAAQGGDAETLKQANNPLANFRALNFQNYYASKLFGLPDDTSNTLWLRYAQPVGRWLIRASLPLNTFPVGGGATESGLGDFNIFGAYLLNKPDAPTSFGVGPLVALPTASDDALGTDKYQLGAAAVYFNAKSPQLQYGGLVTYQTDVAGSSNAADVSLMALQPFAIWQLGGGTYLRSAPIWIVDFENERYNVPIGLGIGKVVKVGATVFNMFIEPQFTALNDGDRNPAFQTFIGLNLQFL